MSELTGGALCLRSMLISASFPLEPVVILLNRFCRRASGRASIGSRAEMRDLGCVGGFDRC